MPPNYDSLIAKLIVYGNNREEAILKLKIALKEYVIDGINTTLPLHEKIISENEFISGNYDIRWLEKFLKNND